MNKETAKREIKELVEKYNRVVEENRVAKYNEEMTKKDFILPLFRALGWNVENSSEVTAEETISKKRVDYGFRINGIPKFFLEAKPLKADLNNPQFAEQAINYAWHKDCTWAVLTDFENIKVFNAEWKTTDLLQSMFFSLDSNQFLERFDQLWLLSKETFEQGLLDKEAEKWGKKSKKSPVGEQLFSDLTKWRSELSKDISQRNKGIKEGDLDEAVQRIIDRLIFIRNCEDRELEPPTLLSAMREWDSKRKGSLAENIVKVFKHFDDEYNSKLFHHHLCDDLDISNQVLEEIIEELYHTKDRSIKYDFAVLDADVLGNVYEQYLGHILKKTAKRATLEEKHAYRKEQGIYYTPTYIVDYIVRNTLGELLKDKKVNVEKIRVLDPACGSGSFLIKAFDVLNEFYSKKEGDHAQTQLDLDTGLPFKQKEKVLLNNIFGVDLDARAVEIAQLNLLLKIAEKKQRLPLLQQNIKCGNSLIEDEKVAKDRAFKWRKEFKQIMEDEGGFDVVIGNPPYGAELNEQERKFISQKFAFSKSYKNTALVFIEKSLDLLKQDGYFGMIVPKSIAFSQLWKPGRELVKKYLVKAVDVSKAFEDVLLEQVIIILSKAIKTKSYTLQDIVSGESITIDKKVIDLSDSIILHGKKKDFEIFEKMTKSSRYLNEVTKTSRGLPFQKYLVKEKTKYPVIKGKTISRYVFGLSDGFLPDKLIEQNKNKVKFLLQPKIISQRIVAHVTKPKDHIIIMSALDKNGLINVDTVENTIMTDKNYSLEFLLCLLNSKLISWYAYRYVFSKAVRTMDLDDYYLGKIPLPNTKIDNQDFIHLVNKMLSLNKQLIEIGDKKTDERQRIEEEIKKTDAEIDELVYKLYGITDDEKKIIGESLR